MWRSEMVAFNRMRRGVVLAAVVVGMPSGSRAVLLAAEPPVRMATPATQGTDSSRGRDSVRPRGPQPGASAESLKNAARSTQPPASRNGLAVLSYILFAVAIIFAFLMVWELWRGGNVALVTHWGGFGGGQGGWQLSPGFVFLIGVLIFGGLGTFALLRDPPSGVTGGAGTNADSTGLAAKTVPSDSAAATGDGSTAPPPAGAPKR